MCAYTHTYRMYSMYSYCLERDKPTRRTEIRTRTQTAVSWPVLCVLCPCSSKQRGFSVNPGTRRCSLPCPVLRLFQPPCFDKSKSINPALHHLWLKRVPSSWISRVLRRVLSIFDLYKVQYLNGYSILQPPAPLSKSPSRALPITRIVQLQTLTMRSFVLLPAGFFSLSCAHTLPYQISPMTAGYSRPHPLHHHLTAQERTGPMGHVPG